MITEQDLEQAIAECQGERNPNSNTCIKLAAFYTIRNEMFGKSEPLPELRYSHADAPETTENVITYDSGTDFSRAIRGMDPDRAWAVMDEMMTAVQALVPRLYNSVMRRLQE